MKRKYKGYIIENWYKQDTDKVDYYLAKPMRYNEVLEIRKEKIERPWHGLDCECAECSYTKADLLHNQKIEEKAQILLAEIRTATFKKLSLKECKKEIDTRKQND